MNINQKDLFALVVRIAGIVGMMKVINHWSRFWHQNHYLWGSHLWQFVFEVILFLIGIFMVLGAPIIIRLLMSNDKDSDSK